MPPALDPPLRRIRSILSEVLLSTAVVIAFQAVLFRDLIRSPDGLLFDAIRPSVDRQRTGPGSAGNDLTRLFLPHHLHVAEQVELLGRLPSWDDRGFAGRPLIGNPQASLFYPPIRSVWWSKRPSALGWLTVGHLVWLGLGVAWLSRTLGRSVTASLFAACCVSGSPYVLAQVLEGHYPHVWGVSWAPWTLALLIRGWRGRRTAFLLAAGPEALGFLAGHFQEWYYLNVMIAIAAVVGLIRRPGCRGVRIAGLAATWMLTLGLIAVELLPDLAVRGETLRSDRMSLRDASRYVVAVPNLAQLLDPLALGEPSNYRGADNYWETVLSIGLIPLSLVLVVLVDRPARRTESLWLIGASFALIFAAGRPLGLFSVCYAVVPWMDGFRVPARVLFFVSMAGAILAGKGFDLVDQAVGARRPRLRRVVASTLFLAGTGELAYHSSRVLVVSEAGSVIAANPIGAFLNTWRTSEGVAPRVRVDHARFSDIDAVNAHVEKIDVGDSFQIERAARLYRRLYRILDPTADDSLPSQLRPSESDLRRLSQKVLKLLNVEFVIAADQPPELDWPIVATTQTRSGLATIYQDPAPLPRAYVVPRFKKISGKLNAVEDLLDLDPREQVLMANDPLDSTLSRQGFTPARATSKGPDRITIEVEIQHPGLLVVANTWMRGWQALDNGKSAEVMPGNLAQCVVALPRPGRHLVQLDYKPPRFVEGLVVSALFWTFWLMCVVRGIFLSLRLLSLQGAARAVKFEAVDP